MPCAFCTFRRGMAGPPFPRQVAKIRQKQRFAVYICIPLHPEGDPQSVAMQTMLFWQSQTFQMMYTKVAEALKRWGPEGAHPCDYLNVYCLANRQPPQSDPPPALGKASPRQQLQQQVWQSGRQMIYVHSKLMICDDEYLMVGSANINHRSMAGMRGTSSRRSDGCIACCCERPDCAAVLGVAGGGGGLRAHLFIGTANQAQPSTEGEGSAGMERKGRQSNGHRRLLGERVQGKVNGQWREANRHRRLQTYIPHTTCHRKMKETFQNLL